MLDDNPDLIRSTSQPGRNVWPNFCNVLIAAQVASVSAANVGLGTDAARALVHAKSDPSAMQHLTELDVSRNSALRLRGKTILANALATRYLQLRPRT
eukprot:COSAG04_NODE_5084_length_1745_cov_3.155640_2_plen_98_part_00